MPAWVALCSVALIHEQADRIRATARRLEAGFQALAAEFPERLSSAQGRGHLAGLKFRQVEDARQFHRRLLEAGLWTRVHAYHEGHSTVLTKLGLAADEPIVDFMIERFRGWLQNRQS
jgi:acetylornithine/succinyldiaminopimelate/putrescine aminotransferase